MVLNRTVFMTKPTKYDCVIHGTKSTKDRYATFILWTKLCIWGTQSVQREHHFPVYTRDHRATSVPKMDCEIWLLVSPSVSLFTLLPLLSSWVTYQVRWDILIAHLLNSFKSQHKCHFSMELPGNPINTAILVITFSSFYYFCITHIII